MQNLQSLVKSLEEYLGIAFEKFDYAQEDDSERQGLYAVISKTKNIEICIDGLISMRYLPKFDVISEFTIYLNSKRLKGYYTAFDYLYFHWDNINEEWQGPKLLDDEFGEYENAVEPKFRKLRSGSAPLPDTSA